MNTALLDPLFAPLGARRFFARHWPDRILATHGPLSRLPLQKKSLVDVEAMLAGLERPVTLYETNTGYSTKKITPERALLAYARGRTVRVDAADDLRADLKRYVEALAEGAGLPGRAPLAYAQAFYSPVGPALPIHFDPAEVVVIQLRGKKRWRLWGATVDAPTETVVSGAALGPDMLQVQPDLAVPEGPPAADVTMRPGSVLFVPRGTWHSTEALTPSASISFVLATPPRLDLLLEQLRTELLTDVEWRTPAYGALGDAASARKAARAMGDLAVKRQRATDLLERARAQSRLK